MKFRTALAVESFSFQLTYRDPLCFLGSCFSENMSEKFAYLGFNSLVNPHGTLFGAHALLENLRRAVLQDNIPENEIVQFNGKWSHLFSHSSLSAGTREALLSNIQRADESLKHQLNMAKVCFITLGSAWVYRHKNTGLVVGNCHKIAGDQFEKFLQTPDEIQAYLNRMLVLLQRVNPDLKVVFTVSPVKHIRDGLVENNLSKSTLLLAVNQLVKSSFQSFYFPAFELLTEDLRDYRFYAEDLAHPNDLAINYIWERLREVIFDEKQEALNNRVIKLRKAMEHRPFDPNTEESKLFQLNLQQQLEALVDETGIRL